MIPIFFGSSLFFLYFFFINLLLLFSLSSACLAGLSCPRQHGLAGIGMRDVELSYTVGTLRDVAMPRRLATQLICIVGRVVCVSGRSREPKGKSVFR